MILMGDLPFRIAFEDSTQRSCKCQLFLRFDEGNLLCRGTHGKSSARRSKRYNLAAR